MATDDGILSYDLTNGTNCTDDCAPLLPPLSPDRHLRQLAMTIGCLIAAVFFLAFVYCAVLNHRLRRRRGALDGDYADILTDHPLWHIRTVGLDAAAIASIGILVYSARDALDAAADCSVCLSEFADGELVRLLPKCSHVFHVPCIDAWLKTHVNCPLCRVPVTPFPKEENLKPSPQSVRENASLSAGSDTRLSFEREVVLEAVVSVDPSAASSHPPSVVPLSELEEGGSESISLPVVETEESFREEEEEPDIAGEQSSIAKGKQGSSSKETEKSSSGSGRRFFFSKHGRSRSTIPPQ